MKRHVLELTANASARAIAIGPSGERIVVGSIAGSTKIGGMAIAGSERPAVLVLRLDAEGEPVWLRTFGGTKSDSATDVVVDARGDLYVAGTFESPTIDFGTGPLRNAGGEVNDLFLVKLDRDGRTLWAHRYGDPSEQIDLALSLSPAGGVVATAWFNGAPDLGSGPLKSPFQKAFFVERIDAAGKGLWGSVLGHRIDYAGTASGTAKSGDVYVSAASDAVVDPGGHPSTRDDLGPVVARYASDGKPMGVKRFGRGADNLTTGLAIDGGGDLRVAVASKGVTTFGGVDASPKAGEEAVTMTRLAPDLSVRWTTHVFDGRLVSIEKVCVDDTGRAFVTGQHHPPRRGISESGFVGAIDADGHVTWLLDLTEAGAVDVGGMALDASGTPIVVGVSGGREIGAGRSLLWIAELAR